VKAVSPTFIKYSELTVQDCRNFFYTYNNSNSAEGGGTSFLEAESKHSVPKIYACDFFFLKLILTNEACYKDEDVTYV
jgi:hypothetical protein